ncbi:MAG: peptide deformylase [Candidatus Saccharibacteria bacterium]|nr:peptide deformylase [Candidatus Saccharibacteria bacterium]
MSQTIQIAKFGNPVLREVARFLDLNDIRSETIQELITILFKYLEGDTYGVGISAPQIGQSVALSVINIKPTPTLPDLQPRSLVIINPKIIGTVGEKKNMWEGCISSGEGKNSLCAKVPRPNTLRLEWLDENGVSHDEVFDGFIAHTIAHEVDHLNGVLFVDRVEDPKTYMLLSEFEKQNL